MVLSLVRILKTGNSVEERKEEIIITNKEMKLREIDMQQIRRDALRISAFREKLWNDTEKHDPWNSFIIVFVFSIIAATMILVLGVILWSKYLAK